MVTMSSERSTDDTRPLTELVFGTAVPSCALCVTSIELARSSSPALALVVESGLTRMRSPTSRFATRYESP